MPTVSVERDLLFQAIGKTFTDEEFDHLCFEFGIELDDITNEKQLKQREAQNSKDTSDQYSESVLYKIDVPANRIDLLCLEGISRALRIFMNIEDPPAYSLRVFSGQEPVQFRVKAATKLARPYIVAAILNNVQLTQERYDSFIDLQDKLHQNICRRRTLVAIGTHDLDTIKGPFTYTALPPEEIQFVPLTQSCSYDAKALLDLYRTNPEYKHLKPYTDIIYDKEVYPVVMDSNDVVLSLPPIINGEHSKISVKTRNILIECTATDLRKAKIVLNTMVTMFSQCCESPYCIEPIQIVYEESSSCDEIVPNLESRQVNVAIQDVYSMLFGQQEPLELDVAHMCKLCDKMQLCARVADDGKELVVQIPPTRSDILHPIDVIEDIGIAYGFNNIPHTIPKTMTYGAPQPLNKLTDQLREEISRGGFMELLTHGLCSHDENFKYLNREDDDTSAVVLRNPATIEFEVVRTSLIPGVLKTIQNNKSLSFKDGLKLFEISDVVLLDPNSDVGASNVRRICAAYTGLTDGFEIIHGLVDRIMLLVGFRNVVEAPDIVSKLDIYYSIDPSSHPTYFPGRCADVILHSFGKTQCLGSFGVLHPRVLGSFELTHPTSTLEINLDPLV
uniref:phenylalanine--tRNA ligase n=1 Tax=Albugo laibachii Nc14 TaxID=890382 RepID=F0X136_9STRA|nr:unnamed protein product [Albugo laibachii Nc14]|eukprot:CCA27490.1 unnamed protein product [Albugo laibachii Nc14]